jgi:hypothetical protein
MQALVRQLMAYGTQSMTDPTSTLAPMRKAGLQQINQAYSSVPGQVTQQMARRGYGSSGAMGDEMYRTGLARAGAVSGLEGQLADRGIQQQQFGASLSDQLMQALRGTDSSTSGTTSMTSKTSGTQVQPGPSIFSSLMGGIAGLSGMLMGLPTTGGGSLGGDWLEKRI